MSYNYKDAVAEMNTETAMVIISAMVTKLYSYKKKGRKYLTQAELTADGGGSVYEGMACIDALVRVKFLKQVKLEASNALEDDYLYEILIEL